MNSIDYSALAPGFDKSGSRLDRLSVYVKLLLIPILLASVIIFPIVLIILLSFLPSVSWLIFVAVLWAGIFWGSNKQKKSRKHKYSKLVVFAKDNHWQHGLIGDLYSQFDGISHPKLPANAGIELYSIKGLLGDTKFELQLGSKDMGTTDSSETTPEMIIQSRKSLPSFTLVSRSVTEGLEILDKMIVTNDFWRKVKLEGDFNKYFQLYIPVGSQVDVLSVVAPDFMQTAKDYSSKYIIQTTASAVSLTPVTQDISVDLLKDMFKAAEEISAEL